ncbi:hypothetical protein V2A60_007499 [Cordyceps javanica]|uniref:Uncharacterized protein n=1 Tax=Cordyceps javanica TaxID=43265 RepID=A0A545W7N3_9HYPO|nr:hypothetical protein IF1G_02882 [Cordyceps javanica]TQW10014.1 hypothetical protein IF2G_02804 [Cordyceps javanica]
MLKTISLAVVLQLAGATTSSPPHDNEGQGMFSGDTATSRSGADAGADTPHSRVMAEFGQGIVESDYHEGKVAMIEVPEGSLMNFNAVFHDELGDYQNAMPDTAHGGNQTAAHGGNQTIAARWVGDKEFFAWCAANAPWGAAFDVVWKAWKGTRTDIRNAAKGCLERMRQAAESNCGLSRVVVGSGDCVCGYILGDKIDAVQFGSADASVGGLAWAKQQIVYNYSYLNANVWHRNIRDHNYQVGIAVGCRAGVVNEEQRVNAQLDLWQQGR